jgi:hypothetical protein
MKKMALTCGIAAAAIGFVLVSAPANAQATRTWVSGVVDDANPCSRTAPCKTFAGAISKTAPAGEINVLDPGGFGAVTITKSITISSVGFEAGVLTSGTNGVVVAAGVNDEVVLEGLDFEGLGAAGGSGIRIISGAVVTVLRCKIHNFGNFGIDMNSSTANSRLLVSNSQILSNNGGGVNVHGNGVINVGAVLDSIIDGNGVFAVQASGAGNVIAAGRSTLTNSPAGISLLNTATAVSFGTSNIVSGTGAFTSAPPFK